jgi:hypothetical protein
MMTLALAAALAALQDPATDWPQWRGPRRDGSAHPAQEPPLSWSATENVLWRADVRGRGHGSPALFGSRIFLAACDEVADVQSVLCFDRATGRLLWEAEVHRGGSMRKNAKSTGASTTPACDGERVYITFPNRDAVFVSALDLDGRRLWQTRLCDYQIHQGYAASPTLHGPLVLAAADHKGGGLVAGLDRKTGAVAWKRDRPKAPNYCSPVVHRIGGRDQLVLIGCDLVLSLDPLDGKVLWETPGATTECVTTTVTDGIHVFSSGGYPRNHLAAFNAVDGAGKLAWETNDRLYVPSLVIRDGKLYGVLDAGMAACWDAATGKSLWKERLGGTFSASPVLVGERIYATNEEGKTFIYRASPEKYEALGSAKLGDEAFGTMVLCGGRIYTRVAAKVDGKRREFLYCIGR